MPIKSIFLFLLLTLLLGFIFLAFSPVNKPIPGATITVLGHTNLAGVTNLLVSVPPILARKPKIPFGHKGWYQLNLQILCARPDGRATNLLWDVGWISPTSTNTYLVPLPPDIISCRIQKAEGILGSFQDINLPINFSGTRQKFTYALPPHPAF